MTNRCEGSTVSTNTMASSNPVTTAQNPFDNKDVDANLILRSSDNVDFYVHKLILKKASPIFADMFALAQDKSCASVSADMPGQASLISTLPIVPIAESSSTFDSLLRIFYPVNDVNRTSLTEVVDILTVALKYEIEKAVTHMKKDLLTYVPSDPIAVYVAACSLNCDYEACVAVKSWKVTYYSYTSSSNYIGGKAYQPNMKNITAGHLYRFIRFCKGDNTSLCSPPPQYSTTSDDQPLLLAVLHSDYPFTHFPDSDIVIRSFDGIDLPTHVAHLTYAGGHLILNLPREKHPESGLPVIYLDEDGRTLATLLQLCYPFGEHELTRNDCSVSVAARARKVAEKYDMPKVAEVAEYLMAEQMNDHPIDVYFAAHRYGWLSDAESATKQCMSLTDLEGPGMYTREMEFVSAEVYYNLLKRHDGRYTPTSVSGVQTKKKRSRR